MLVGLALVLVHNIWVRDWLVSITLFAWTSMVRVLVAIFRPDWIGAAGGKLLEKPAYFAAGAVNLIIGLVLTGIVRRPR